MAKVMGPYGGSECRGKVGSVSFNMWRGIQYVRSISTPVTLNSDRQLHVRAISKALTEEWQAITDSERSAWNYYATQHIETNVLGSPKRLSGYNWFLRCNFLLLDAEISLFCKTPPKSPCLFIPKSSNIFYWSEDGSTYIQFDYNSYPGAAMDFCYLDMWLTKPLSAGRKPTIHDAVHYMYNYPLEDNPWTSQAITLTGLYGLYFRLFNIDSGARSPWGSDKIFVNVV